MKTLLALMLFLVGSQTLAFELMEPLTLHNALISSFPKIASTSDCYSSFYAESMKCSVNEANSSDVSCEATGYDSQAGGNVTITSKDVKLVEALHQADLSFLTFIEMTNINCQKNGGDPNLCRGQQETVSCNLESYMSH